MYTKFINTMRYISCMALSKTTVMECVSGVSVRAVGCGTQQNCLNTLGVSKHSSAVVCGEGLL